MALFLCHSCFPNASNHPQIFHPHLTEYLYCSKILHIMEIASLAEIKKELQLLSQKELIVVIADLAKFSTDNKLFLYFQLYGRDSPSLFKEMVQQELYGEFQTANTRNYHYAKKSAQGIRRKLNKFIKFTKDKPTQIELIAFFCEMIYEYGYLAF